MRNELVPLFSRNFTPSSLENQKLAAQLKTLEAKLQQSDEALKKNGCATVVGTTNWCYFFLQDMDGCGNENHYKEHCTKFQDTVFTGGESIDVEDDALSQNGCTCGHSPEDVIKREVQPDPFEPEGDKPEVFGKKLGVDGQPVSMSFRLPHDSSHGKTYYSFYRGRLECQSSYNHVSGQVTAAVAKGRGQSK